MTELEPIDKSLIYLLSGDLGEAANPYAELAEKLGISEEKVLLRVQKYSQEGLIRRLGATLWHQRSGFAANAMMVFKLPSDQVDEGGRKLAENPSVSHCYFRRTAPDWPFNLYAMVHAHSHEELKTLVQHLAEDVAAEQWRVLESLKELKKDSLRYFVPNLRPDFL